MLSNLIEGTEIGESVLEWMEVAALGIEILAVVIIVVAILWAILVYFGKRLSERGQVTLHYKELKVRLGKILLLSLEILVAADIVRTVALETTIESVAVLGLLVLIRTFLSLSLVVEIEERWPWQPKRPEG